MTSSIDRKTAKAAADRERAIARIVGRLRANLAAMEAVPRARCERINLGAIQDGPGGWAVVVTDGTAAILSRGVPGATFNADAARVLLPALTGPAMPVPAGMGPALRRVMTCASRGSFGKGGRRIPHVRIIHTNRERLELRTDNAYDGCSAREWLPADVGDLDGRHIALDGEWLREALIVAGDAGRIVRPAKVDIKTSRIRFGGEVLECSPVGFIAGDDLWAYVLMATMPEGK